MARSEYTLEIVWFPYSLMFLSDDAMFTPNYGQHASFPALIISDYSFIDSVLKCILSKIFIHWFCYSVILCSVSAHESIIHHGIAEHFIDQWSNEPIGQWYRVVLCLWRITSIQKRKITFKYHMNCILFALQMQGHEVMEWERSKFTDDKFL